MTLCQKSKTGFLHRTYRTPSTHGMVRYVMRLVHARVPVEVPKENLKKKKKKHQVL